MADIASNEPGLSSALGLLESVVARIEAAGIPRSRIVLLGFSQGACLTAEFAVRHASRFGGVVVFSGGAIGPPGTRWDDAGRFDGTPVFLGCSDRDSHVPEPRVIETAELFTRMGADVTTRIYPGMGHLVNDDEIAFAQGLLDGVGSGALYDGRGNAPQRLSQQPSLPTGFADLPTRRTRRARRLRERSDWVGVRISTRSLSWQQARQTRTLNADVDGVNALERRPELTGAGVAGQARLRMQAVQHSTTVCIPDLA